LFPFWEIAIAPLLRAVQPRRVLEIGALRGETTELLCELLGPGAELHVIDPKPQFDPDAHVERFPGRYIFHRTTSHEALPELPAMDVALIDGDHNWYTVRGELQLLAGAARDAGAPLPVLVLHDVCWPYGRRDLYYDPTTIPAEHRQPHARRGMRSGQSRLVQSGGVNPTLHNAIEEGGPRNGVMTALEEFLDERQERARVVVLPVYFGLAIVADEARLLADPNLEGELDRLEGPEARLELMRLAESLRLRSVLAEHTAVFGVDDRVTQANRRYLDLLKSALLHRHYLEDELRLGYFHECSREGRKPEAEVLRDPAHNLRGRLPRLEVARDAGVEPEGLPGPASFPYANTGKRRLDHLEHCLDAIRRDSVRGDLLDCGVGRGGTTIFLRGYLTAHGVPDRTVWAADRFLNPEIARSDASADLNMVRTGIARFDLLDERIKFLQGPPEDAIEQAPRGLALARVDVSRFDDVEPIVVAAWRRLGPGGFLVVDGLDESLQARLAELRATLDESGPLLRIDSRAVVWRRTDRNGEEDRPLVRPPLPLAPAAPADAIELSVLVVFHNMRREAQRTLHSLSRAYQRGIADLDYEVIAIENGSDPSERLGEELVSSFGPEFRYVDMGAESRPSPAFALNRGVETSRGRTIAFMIDGAHILTPGVLQFAVKGSRAHEPAVVATQQWYLGPGQQVDTVAEGYGREYEDRLLDRIRWPTDGYRLFEIGHFVGNRDWLDGMWESNCLFVPRKVAQQVGSLDERFELPGGGFANLDLYERAIATPGLNLVTLLGEGSFHQAHGGTTTNEQDATDRASRLTAYRDEYMDLKGRPYRTASRFHYVGGMVDSARRSKPRRMGAKAFLRTAEQLAGDDLPRASTPLPAELEEEYRDGYWRSFRWKKLSWLGRPVERAPGDLLAYQQMIADAKPDWIVTTSQDAAPGRDLYLASLCQFLGHGEVLALCARERDQAAAAHPRLHPLTGDAYDPAVAASALDRVDAPARALLILGRESADRLVETFELYWHLVPIGSWVVLEDTIMNGHPIWPAMGPGPAEAARRIVQSHPELVPDRDLEAFGVTFNPQGYLKRVA